MRLSKVVVLALLTWFTCVGHADDEDFNYEPDAAPTASEPATPAPAVDSADPTNFKEELNQVEGDTKAKVPEPEANHRPRLVSPADDRSKKAVHKESSKKSTAKPETKKSKAAKAKATKAKVAKDKAAKKKAAAKKKKPPEDNQ